MRPAWTAVSAAGLPAAFTGLGHRGLCRRRRLLKRPPRVRTRRLRWLLARVEESPSHRSQLFPHQKDRLAGGGLPSPVTPKSRYAGGWLSAGTIPTTLCCTVSHNRAAAVQRLEPSGTSAVTAQPSRHARVCSARHASSPSPGWARSKPRAWPSGRMGWKRVACLKALVGVDRTVPTHVWQGRHEYSGLPALPIFTTAETRIGDWK
jgi:hypothetical protein